MAQEAGQLDLPLDRVEAIGCRHCGKRVTTGTWPLLSTVPCPYCTKPLTVSGQLGPFLVSGIIARGAIAWVFRGVEPAIHQPVMLQVVKPDPEEPEVLKSFIAQSRALAKSRHPNLARVLSLGQTRHMTYLVLGAVEGDPLRSLIESKRMLTEAQALGLAIDVAQGLREAAELGATHGDLQADSIVIQPDGVAVVMNFGLDLFGGKLTASGKVWGSPLYIAPEKLQGKGAGIQSDMYSLGCLLHHLLTAHPPFQGNTSRDIAAARLKHPAPDIRMTRQDLSPAAAHILMKLLRRKPADRFTTYSELLAALHAAAAGTQPETAEFQAPDDEVVFADEAWASPAYRPARHRMPRTGSSNGVFFALVLVGLGIVVVLVLIVQSLKSPPPGMRAAGLAPQSPYFPTPANPRNAATPIPASPAP